MKGRDLIETVLLYVGIPAFTLYPLGFVALGIEMWRDPFFPYYDFDAVWNAVSLVPQTVVIGTGVRLLYLSLISTVLGVGVASLVYRLFHRTPPGSDEEAAPLGGWWRLYLLVLLPIAVLLLWSSITTSGTQDFGYVAGFFAFSIGSGVIIGYARGRDDRRQFLGGLAVAYVGAMLAALCIAAAQTPRLPLVEINSRETNAPACSGVPADRMFVLLAESESYWFVYNREGLLALPNSEAQIIRYRDCPGYLGRD